MKGTLYFVLLSVLITGCSKNHISLKKREQVLSLTHKEELKIGEKAFHDVIRQSKVCTNLEQKAMINRVFNKLKEQLKGGHCQWKIYLVEDDRINACCYPGGKIIINSGVFKVVENDDQLATVLSHEMSHALLRHGNERITRNKSKNMYRVGGSILAGVINPLLIIPYLITQEGVYTETIEYPANRIEELEADKKGLSIMKKAGYDVNESIVFWKNLEKLSDKNKKRRQTTHLSYEKRIKKLEQMIKKL